MQNYALIQGANLTEVAGPKLISAGGSISLPLPANSEGLAFACEAELALPALMNATAVTKYLNFQTVDVQNTQYVVALDASGVDFAKVASVACTVTLPTLPSIAPWRTTLTANLKADSDRVQIPIENAVFTLPGTINLTVNSVDSNAAPLTLTLQNDFTTNPVFVLLQSQLASSSVPSSATAGAVGNAANATATSAGAGASGAPSAATTAGSSSPSSSATVGNAADASATSAGAGASGAPIAVSATASSSPSPGSTAGDAANAPAASAGAGTSSASSPPTGSASSSNATASSTGNAANAAAGSNVANAATVSTGTPPG